MPYLHREGWYRLLDPVAAGTATHGTAEPHRRGWHHPPLRELKSGQTLILANSRAIPADSSGPAQSETQPEPTVSSPQLPLPGKPRSWRCAGVFPASPLHHQPPAPQGSLPATEVPLRSPQPAGDSDSPSPEAAGAGSFAGSAPACTSTLPTVFSQAPAKLNLSISRDEASAASRGSRPHQREGPTQHS